MTKKQCLNTETRPCRRDPATRRAALIDRTWFSAGPGTYDQDRACWTARAQQLFPGINSLGASGRKSMAELQHE